MFDIGFWEIVLISVIGLIVLGPERLPTAIRSVMHWINTAKGMANAVKTEISQELKLHEMNENMIKASKQELSDLDPQLKKSIAEMQQNAQEMTRPYQTDNEIRKSSQQAEDSSTDKNTQGSNKSDKSE